MLGKAWTTVRKAADACQEWGGGWWRITLWTVGPMRWRLQLWPTQSRKGDKTARAHLCTWELKPVQEDTSKPWTLDMSPSQMSSRLRLRDVQPCQGDWAKPVVSEPSGPRTLRTKVCGVFFQVELSCPVNKWYFAGVPSQFIFHWSLHFWTESQNCQVNLTL